MLTLRQIDDATLLDLFGYAKDEDQLNAIEAEIARRGIYGRKKETDDAR